MLTVEQVNGDRAGMRAFLDLPYRLYADSPHWVAPLRLEQRRLFSPGHPFAEHARIGFFLARRDGRVVGRTTAHTDRNYDAFHGVRQGFFGFFESVNDPEVARGLMDAAEAWLRREGAQSVIGPMNFSTNQEVGFLVHGHERPPVMMMPYTHPYYPALFEPLGYRRERELLAYWFGDVKDTPRAIGRSAERVRRRAAALNWRIRMIDKRNLKRDVEAVVAIFNAAWSRNWGFVPMTPAEVAETATAFRLAANPRVALILTVDDKPAACLICLPDLNEAFAPLRDGRLFPFGIFRALARLPRVRTVRLLLMGVDPTHRGIGLDVLLYERVYEEFLRHTRYRNAEISWILEDNHLMRRLVERIVPEPYKRYLILRKDLV